MADILYTALFSSLLRPPLCCTAVSCTTSATEMKIYLYVSPAIKSYLQKRSLIHEEKRSSPAYDFSIFITVCLFKVFSLEQCTTKCWSLANASMFKYLLQSKYFFIAAGSFIWGHVENIWAVREECICTKYVQTFCPHQKFPNNIIQQLSLHRALEQNWILWAI